MSEPSASDRLALPGEVEIIAHRGFSAEAPENTVAALRAGLAAGADAVEFDLHMARDGTPVLMHDDTLQRTTDGRGSVADHTLAELSRLDAGGWFGPEFAGEPVPTLAAALAALSSTEARVYAEVKSTGKPSDQEDVVRIVSEARRLDSTVFISMDWEALDRIREAEPRALVGYIVDKRSRAQEGMDRAEGDPGALLDYDARILLRKPELAEAAAARGIPLATWTVDTVEDAAELLWMGVPRITTNRVRDLVRWRDERARASAG